MDPKMKRRDFLKIFALVGVAVVVAACTPTEPTAAFTTVPEATAAATAVPKATAAATAVPEATATATAVPTVTAAATAVSKATAAATVVPETTAAATAVSVDTIVVATDATFGEFLTDAKGMALYLYTADSAGQSACSGDCLAAWPALTVAEGTTPVGGAGVNGKLGTITRDDGTLQVTINDLPLYYFAQDKAAGDTTGQGLNDVWYLSDPAGILIK